MSRLGSLLSAALLGSLVCSCQTLSRFDTKNGAAYCGSIVSAPFVRTLESEGGFQGNLRLRLELDTDHLSTTPGKLTTDDAADGPCAPQATFDGAGLRVTQEFVHDALSTMTFEDGQIQNVVAWVDSTCRGPMLAVVSLLKSNRVDVRLLKPSAAVPAGTAKQDAFSLFSLDRHDSGCGY